GGAPPAAADFFPGGPAPAIGFGPFRRLDRSVPGAGPGRHAVRDQRAAHFRRRRCVARRAVRRRRGGRGRESGRGDQQGASVGGARSMKAATVDTDRDPRSAHPAPDANVTDTATVVRAPMDIRSAALTILAAIAVVTM